MCLERYFQVACFPPPCRSQTALERGNFATLTLSIGEFPVSRPSWQRDCFASPGIPASRSVRDGGPFFLAGVKGDEDETGHSVVRRRRGGPAPPEKAHGPEIGGRLADSGGSGVVLADPEVHLGTGQEGRGQARGGGGSRQAGRGSEARRDPCGDAERSERRQDRRRRSPGRVQRGGSRRRAGSQEDHRSQGVRRSEKGLGREEEGLR